jgi:hypothetical protein
MKNIKKYLVIIAIQLPEAIADPCIIANKSPAT